MNHTLTRALTAVFALATGDLAVAAPPGGHPGSERGAAQSAGGKGNGGQKREVGKFPGAQWKSGPPQSAGLSPAGLAEMNAVAEQLGSTCMLVVHDGRVVSEWYAPGYGPDTVHANVFSVTKSVTSTLVGIAREEGLLDLDDRAADAIEGWAGTPSEAVTVRHLVSNDSGRFWSLESDYGALLYGADQTGYAIGLEQAVAPGTHWEYNNAAIQTLERVLEVATGEDVEAYARRKLFDPIGMSATFARDGAGNALVYQGLSTSCHDIARFGWLMLEDGRWAGHQVVPADWVREATAPSTPLNDAYGYLWWLNREGRVVEPTFPDRREYDGRLVPAAGEQVYAAIGAFGQLVIVDPVGGYVVVRLQDVLDLEAALANDPDPLGVTKLDTLLTAFERARR